MKPVKDGNFLLVSVPFFSDLTPLALALRREVFVEEQKVPLSEEFDERDLPAVHLIGVLHGNVVATCRLIFQEGFIQLSRFAVRRSVRGIGVGRAMVQYSQEVALHCGHKRLYLEAQTDKIDFYRRFGFKEYGDMFDDAGIPHQRMKNY